MKTRVIPAQITTVEDKIAGSLSLTQILLLMTPIFWTAIVYALFLPLLQLAIYKVALISIVLTLCLILAIRIKEKLVLNWLVVLITYQLRPKYYLFNKNDAFLRVMDFPSFEKKHKTLFKKAVKKNTDKEKSKPFSLREAVRLDGLLSDPKYTFSLKTVKKGGFNVDIRQTHE